MCPFPLSLSSCVLLVAISLALRVMLHPSLFSLSLCLLWCRSRVASLKWYLQSCFVVGLFVPWWCPLVHDYVVCVVFPCLSLLCGRSIVRSVSYIFLLLFSRRCLVLIVLYPPSFVRVCCPIVVRSVCAARPYIRYIHSGSCTVSLDQLRLGGTQGVQPCERFFGDGDTPAEELYCYWIVWSFGLLSVPSFSLVRPCPARVCRG